VFYPPYIRAEIGKGVSTVREAIEAARGLVPPTTPDGSEAHAGRNEEGVDRAKGGTPA